jgi:CDP-6-deoxy-D-xylo-4-hexulose-3-dehydrase
MVLAPAKRYPLAHVTYGDEEMAAVMMTLRAGQTTCGPQVRQFEQSFASYVGREHAVMVNSGSSADLLIAFGLGPAQPGDEVLVPAVTWPTQVWSCTMAGYTVRLVDVDPATLQMDVADLKRKVNIHARCVFLTHVLGNVGNLDDLDDVDIPILEDCCEAMGARWRGKHVGTLGSAAAFSFFFSHLLNTMEGGMVVTDEVLDARDYRLWRSHGWEPKADFPFWFPTWGLNVRPTEIQGAFGNVQMTRLESFRQARVRNYERLTAAIPWGWLHGITVLPECEPAWHGFPMMVAPDAPFWKADLCRFLDAHGVETRPIVAGNFAEQPVAQGHPQIIAEHLPGADRIHRDGFYIGISSFDDEDGAAYVGEVVSEFMRQWG